MKTNCQAGVSLSETPHIQETHVTRAVEYKRGSQRFQRCSRCHVEQELTAPVLYNARGESAPQTTGLAPVLVGQDLLGFICSGCFHAVCKHIASVFPDSFGFPFVNKQGQLQPTPRCQACSFALAYASDGRSMYCPECSKPKAPPRELTMEDIRDELNRCDNCGATLAVINHQTGDVDVLCPRCDAESFIDTDHNVPSCRSRLARFRRTLGDESAEPSVPLPCSDSPILPGMCVHCGGKTTDTRELF